MTINPYESPQVNEQIPLAEPVLDQTQNSKRRFPPIIKIAAYTTMAYILFAGAVTILGRLLK